MGRGDHGFRESRTAGGPDSFDGPASLNHHVDTLVNTGCFNPTKISGERWSIYAYNLEIAPNTDAVFAKLLMSLYDDLEETRHELACETHHTGARHRSGAACARASRSSGTAARSLDKCDAATMPKYSAGDENCGRSSAS